MKIVVVGNGILGLTAAYRLSRRSSSVQVTVLGPREQAGCASAAAAAMLNSFCEVDAGTLDNERERERFDFNRQATPLWPDFLRELQADLPFKIESGVGTFLINNHATDSLEDENFEAVVAALQRYHEPFERVEPKNIPQYRPASPSRASRAIYIPNEGWVNPLLLMAALRQKLERSPSVRFIDGSAHSVMAEGDRIIGVKLEDGQRIEGDSYLLAPGATFSRLIENSNLGLTLPRIFYGVGSSLLLKTDGNTLRNCIRTPNRGLACGVYAAPQDSTHTVIGASNFISPVPESFARVTSVHLLLKSAMEQIHTDYYRSQLVRVNVGWRPTSEDTFPLIGKTSLRNLFIATGTKRDGLHCSPLIAQYLSDLMLEGTSAIAPVLFAPERRPHRIFSREEAIRISVRHTINAAYQHGFVPAKNRMAEEMERFHSEDLNRLHDQVGAQEWGIPPEMINMYRYGHLK